MCCSAGCAGCVPDTVRAQLSQHGEGREANVPLQRARKKERKTYARHQACVKEAQLRPSTVLLAPPSAAGYARVTPSAHAQCSCACRLCSWQAAKSMCCSAGCAGCVPDTVRTQLSQHGEGREANVPLQRARPVLPPLHTHDAVGHASCAAGRLPRACAAPLAAVAVRLTPCARSSPTWWQRALPLWGLASPHRHHAASP